MHTPRTPLRGTLLATPPALASVPQLTVPPASPLALQVA